MPISENGKSTDCEKIEKEEEKRKEKEEKNNNLGLPNRKVSSSVSCQFLLEAKVFNVYLCVGVPKFSVAFTCVCVRKQQHTINNNNNNNIANTPSGGLPRSHSAEPAASTLSLSAASAEKKVEGK